MGARLCWEIIAHWGVEGLQPGTDRAAKGEVARLLLNAGPEAEAGDRADPHPQVVTTVLLL